MASALHPDILRAVRDSLVHHIDMGALGRDYSARRSQIMTDSTSSTAPTPAPVKAPRTDDGRFMDEATYRRERERRFGKPNDIAPDAYRGIHVPPTAFERRK